MRNNSNRWQDILEVTKRCYIARILPEDDNLAPDGRVMEVLSEHQCQGWLEGYLLTGRHGFFSCYEAFIHIIDSMFNQHAKWLKVCNHIPWRRPIASPNYLLSSHVWRQYIARHRDDMPDIRDWRWGGKALTRPGGADTAADNV